MPAPATRLKSALAPQATLGQGSARPGRARSIALLITGPLLCVVALTALAYIGLTQQARQAAIAQAGVAAQVARDALLRDTGTLRVTNGELVSSLPANVTALNNNSAEAQRLRTQTGTETLIAERERNKGADSLVIVASSITPAQGRAAQGLGAQLSGALGSLCAANTNGASTTATLTIGGADYLAGAAPLTDGNGACVGAVVAAVPVASLATGPLEYTIILALAGSLLALLTVAVGLMLTGRGAVTGAGAAPDLSRLRAALAHLDDAAQACAAQANQREWLGRRLSGGRQNLAELSATLTDDRLTLQDSATDIWAGMSQPGAPMDPHAALRLAREGAVVAARLGSRLEDFDTVTEALLSDLAAADDVDAMLTMAMAQTEAAMRELRAAALPLLAHDSGPQQARPAVSGRHLDAGADDADDADDAWDTRGAPSPWRARGTGVHPTARGRTGVHRALAPDQRGSLDRPSAPGYRPNGSQPDFDPRQTGVNRAVRPDGSQARRAPGMGGALGGQMGQTGQSRIVPTPGQSLRGPHPAGGGGLYGRPSQPGQQPNPNQQTGRRPAVNGQGGINGLSGRYPAQRPTPRPQPGQQPDQQPGQPYAGRDPSASGSRWLND